MMEHSSWLSAAAGVFLGLSIILLIEGNSWGFGCLGAFIIILAIIIYLIKKGVF